MLEVPSGKSLQKAPMKSLTMNFKELIKKKIQTFSTN